MSFPNRMCKSKYTKIQIRSNHKANSNMAELEGFLIFRLENCQFFNW